MRSTAASVSGRSVAEERSRDGEGGPACGLLKVDGSLNARNNGVCPNYCTATVISLSCYSDGDDAKSKEKYDFSLWEFM